MASNRMDNLLDCCLHTVNILVPLCDLYVTCAITKEEAVYFMSPVCFNILRVMADLQGLFNGSFLRKFDTDDALLIEVFNESERIIDELGNLRTPLHDSFLAGLSEDGNGNILFIKADSSGEEVKNTLSCCRFQLAQIRQIGTKLRGLLMKAKILK